MSGDGKETAGGAEKWSVLYPAYLNSNKTVAEGRRVAAAKACANPTCVQIADCCSRLKIPCKIESDKAYPRDPLFQVGRVRALLRKDDGSPANPNITTKKQLMLHVAELLPKHIGRTRNEPASSSSAAASSSSAAAADPVKFTKGGRKNTKGGRKKK